MPPESASIGWTGINIEEDYRNLLDICKNKKDLPNISMVDSTKILNNMKSSVSDFYSVTTLHYINAGNAGFEHFNFLLNCIIDDVNNASIEELNAIYALLLHKGHKKPKTVDKSYRTISSCPLLSKALDLYVRQLHKDKWKKHEAPTQYQGEGSSHELAALLLTEVIQHSLFTLKEPIYLLFLDAKSAFDVVVPKLLLRNMFLAGMDGNTINYLNNRFLNRQTYLDWNKNIMGPILDQLGLEQGGINSGDFYKLYNNDLLLSTQKSQQGVNLGNDLVISSIGLADDTALPANNLFCLANILYLVLEYCKKYDVQLCPDKTKLIRLSNNLEETDMEMFNPISIAGKTIDFAYVAEHVGILRSVDGNLPNIMNRISCHTSALNAVLFAGIARRHRANPAVGLRIERIYATPVLMSGLAALVLSESEISTIDLHFKETCENLQKLLPKTPRSVVYFLGGCLPARAILHLRQLTIFGMVIHLADDPLNIHARKVLSEAKPSSRSWFWQVREICLMYNLKHPLQLLEDPPAQPAYKKLIKSHVIDYWEKLLRAEASPMLSLTNFCPKFMSLQRPHPIWTTVGSNPYEVTKAIQQARLLSGRYRTEALASHWSNNPDGYCLAPDCSNILETVKHILLECPAYSENRKRLKTVWQSSDDRVIDTLTSEALSGTDEYLLQFILDCSILPNVISSTQKHSSLILDKLFYLTRTWCFSIHRSRMKLLGRWNLQ
jgi:hypothetical protein